MKRLVFFTLALVVLAATVATASAWTPTREQLNERRWNVMNKREAKCLSTWTPKPMSEIPKERYPRAWAWWTEQRDRVSAKASRCFAERMWNWFYSSGASCVKSHEGAWTSNTGNGYYGGFQADMSFQRAYGGEYLSRWGTANNWSPVYQIHMAYRGWLARGWAPWPTTSVMCGLA